MKKPPIRLRLTHAGTAPMGPDSDDLPSASMYPTLRHSVFHAMRLEIVEEREKTQAALIAKAMVSY